MSIVFHDLDLRFLLVDDVFSVCKYSIEGSICASFAIKKRAATAFFAFSWPTMRVLEGQNDFHCLHSSFSLPANLKNPSTAVAERGMWNGSHCLLAATRRPMGSGVADCGFGLPPWPD